MKKLFALVLAAVMLCLNGCREEAAEADYQPIDPADVVAHRDTTSVYDAIGRHITIDMVQEDPETGLAWVEYQGVRYELGMDFLSFAMVYNCQVPAASQRYHTREDVYNHWYKLYLQRWNYLVPEIPLYANQYYDLYTARLENFVTSPYWGAAEAVVGARLKSGDTITLGNTTDLSGAFRNAVWGKANPGASDQDIESLTTGYATVQTDINGAFLWNEYALAQTPQAVKNQDGTLTYTIHIRPGLVFSDGSPITAKHYIAYTLANSTPVGVAAGGTGAAGQVIQGYAQFKAYDGSNLAEPVGEAVASPWFTGVKLLDEYSFSVTYEAEYADYYYVMSYAAFTPSPLELYLGGNDIVVREDGACGLTPGFYQKVEKNGAQVYAMADVIQNNLKWNSGLPWSGPYRVANYDPAALTATLVRNPSYPGDTARGSASIGVVTYIKTVAQTQLDMFKTGQVDILEGLMEKPEIEAALALVRTQPEKYAQTHYDRAGYGKLGLRCDFGPTAMAEVRQAIMYTINRPEFAQTFTGGYGAVVHGPYYKGFPAFRANREEILLNQYAYSPDTAVAILEEGGWIYNQWGEPYRPGQDSVRYKRLSGYQLSRDNLYFATVDGRYRTVKLAGQYYMPLAINWYGTQPNPVTDLLITAWQGNPNATRELGMYITYTTTDFSTGLYGELLRMEAYGYNGQPKLNALNFAAGYTSAVYDQSFSWTLDPQLQAGGYNMAFLNDEADFLENYSREGAQ